MLKALRKEHRLPLQRIRRAIEHYGERHGIEHLLLDPRLETDGYSLLLHNNAGYEDLTQFGQLAMGSVVSRYMRRIERKPKQLDFFPFVLSHRDGDDEPRSVLISPAVAFGQPVLAGTGVTTEVIAGRFMARDPLTELAEEYGVAPAWIEEAIRWESSKLKHAA